MIPRRNSGRTPVRLQDTVRLSAGGIAKVLGDLEARVMNVAWALDQPASAREIHEVVLREHDVALLTVITVLNKLADKRLLQRRKIRDLYHYSPRLSREEFLAVTSRRLVEGILALAPDAVAASLVDVLAEHDPEKLAALGRLVRKRLREQGE
jgi:predicted transcriptional regulator